MNKYLETIELALINGTIEVVVPEDYQSVEKHYLDFINAALSGQLDVVLGSQLGLQMLDIMGANDELTSDKIVQSLEANVQQFLKCDCDDESKIRQLIVLITAVSCLQLFVQNNWVGPVDKLDATSLLCQNYIPSQEACLSDFASNYLSVDGEAIYPICNGPLFLAVSRVLLSNCSQCLSSCKTAEFWLLRCCHIQQMLLDERSPTIKSTVMGLIKSLSGSGLFASDEVSRQVAMQFHLESAHLLYFYYEDVKAREHFDIAKTLSGLTIELKGALGKRTKFQEKDVSQLVLQVERNTEVPLDPKDDPKDVADVSTLPKNVALNDDQILDNIQFKDPQSFTVIRMTALEQALVIGLCAHHRKTHEGQGKIVQEESLAFINCVLSQPRNWCVQTKALLMRAKWETETSRQMQRSLSQLEELVSQFNRVDVSGCHRLPLVFSVALTPKWLTERHLGNVLMEIGAIASALEVYVRLQMWEDVIKCHIILGHKNEAEKLIRNQMVIKETPNLWCYLGDVTDNPEDYLSGWNLSNGRSARAQRSLAYLCVRNRELEKSLPYFEKSLELNPLQVGVWFTYGCTSLSCGQYDKAAKAFRRSVNLNSDSFEAWNNLATAYIRANDKPRAFLTLQEAIKYDFDNWRMWENYLLVSIDVGEFEESIRAYQRLLEIKQKHIDVQVLRILVRAIGDNLEDAGGRPTSRLRPKTLQLFAKITSTIVNDPDVWHLYARLMMTGTDYELSQADVKSTLKHLLNAYRFYTMDGHWDSDVDKCQSICQRFVELSQEYEECLERLEDKVQKGQMATSARLTIKSLIMRIEKNYLDPITNELPKALIDSIKILEKSVQKFLEMSQRQ